MLMKSRIINQFALVILVTCINLLKIVHVQAQTITNLHSFGGSNGEAYPYGGLTLSGNTLYGTTEGNGSGNIFGAIFAVNIDGSGFTNLQSFSGGSDGAYPKGGVVISGSTLY